MEQKPMKLKRKNTEKSMKLKPGFFEKINKINKLTKEKKGHDIRNERDVITIDPSMDIKRIIKEHDDQLYVHKFEM